MAILKRQPDRPMIPFFDYVPELPVTHDDIAADLAAYLNCPGRAFNHGRLTWQNIEFPDTSCRPDVFSICATLMPERWLPVTFEVKATRKDFFKDIGAHKWTAYRPFSSRVVFAAMKGVIRPEDLPASTGLIERSGDGWEWARKGRSNSSWKITERQWMNLCLKGRDASPRELRDVAYGRRAS